MNSIHTLSSKIEHSKLQPYIPGNNALTIVANLGHNNLWLKMNRVIIHLQNSGNYKFGDKLSHSNFSRDTSQQTWSNTRKGKFQMLPEKTA